MTRWRLAAGVAAIACGVSGGTQAGTLWMGSLSGASENPPVNVPYTGTGFIVLNDAETSGVVTVTHNVPPAIVVDGHIHRAPVGTNGPVIFPFPRVGGPAGLSPVGPLTWAIPAGDVVSLKNGGLYFNIHTQQNPGGAIRGQIFRATLVPAATNPGQLAVANALDISAGYTPDLDQALMSAAVATSAARTQFLDELSGRTVFSQGRQAIEAMHGFQDSLFRQADDMAGGPEDGVTPFVEIGQTFGQRDTRIGQAGSKVSRTSLMAGVAVGTTAARAGLAVGFAKGEDKFRNSGGDTEAKTTSVNVFASTGAERGLKFTAAAGYGWSKFDTQRNLAVIGRSAASSHDGRVWSVGAKVSAPLAMGGLQIAPYGQIDHQQASVNAYQEIGAGGVGLVIPKLKVKDTALEAGAAVTLPLQDGPGGLAARLQAGWRHSLDDDDETFVTGFSGTPVAFQTTVASPGKDAAHLEASLEGKISENLSASASYRGLISKRGDLHALQIRLSLKM
jgi:uncharacterized protein YhjY with autotransporter beta-barrel domain